MFGWPLQCTCATKSCQAAFGGHGGKYPQYYWAYEELRLQCSHLPSHPPLKHAQAGYGMPSNYSKRLDEAMAAESENLSLSSINSMREVLDLLSDMLHAVNPTDSLAVKDEVKVDLVEQCCANQKKLMHMLTTTGDEELLDHGLALNDSMRSVLAKHDAIACGSPLPTHVIHFSPQLDKVHDFGLKIYPSWRIQPSAEGCALCTGSC